PTLRIRDYGPGLSHDDVFNVYTKYGASTKRSSDEVVGMLGIGSKSGFSYADSFTIVSWHGGHRRTYVAVLDESEKGAINLLEDVECDATDTGLEIQIAVKSGDIYDFERTARKLFRHFDPRPEINIELPAAPDEVTRLSHGLITPGGGEWIAIMGCVPYRINLGQLDEREIPRCLSSMSGQLKFAIGDVQINASREELKYSPLTKAALVEKFTALVDEYVTHALKQLEAGVFDDWQSRLRVQVLSKLDLPLPEKWKPLAESFAKVSYTCDQFGIIHNKAACTRLLVTEDTTLLIDDTGLDLSGYYLSHDDYIVRDSLGGKTPEQLRAVLDDVLKQSGLTGVKIELLSTKHWTAPVVPQKRKTNPKHRARMFTLDPDGDFAAPWSDNWEAVTRVPTPDDVFVLIEGFKPDEYSDFWAHYRADKLLCRAFGIDLPSVYGYKTTEKRPVLESACEGTSYREWRKTLAAKLLTPENIALVEQYHCANPNPDSSYYRMSMPTDARRKWLVEQLGDAHPISELIVRCHTADRALHKLYSDDSNTITESVLSALSQRLSLTWNKSEIKVAFDELRGLYPLLRRAGFVELWGHDYGGRLSPDEKSARDEWLDYVQMVDTVHNRTVSNVVQLVSVP
ncbi:MAG: ATP-binding protein, partial [Tepidisphaeraceae bacterium]